MTTPTPLFETMFQGTALDELTALVDRALDEDGPDLTSMAVFAPEDAGRAQLVAKQEAVMAGLPLTALVLERAQARGEVSGPARARLLAADGDAVTPGTVVAEMEGPVRTLLLAERTALNLLCHLSGVATLTAAHVRRLRGSHTRLLDTRKTLPGLRRLEKYAVRVGGGHNHRMDLAEMCMLKDNHIDRAGGIAPAVAAVRALPGHPPIEVECRTLDEVRQAVALDVSRIMLDNMDQATMARALVLVPRGMETEISGNVSLETIGELGRLGADYVSVGRVTHSAPAADVSMRVFVKK